MHSKKAEISKIEKKKGVWQSIQLNSDQEKKVKKCVGGGDDRWHRYYMAFTGNFDEKYFPDVLFSSKLEPLLNDRRYCKSIEDKSLIPIWYSSIKELYIPRTVVSCSSSIYYDGDYNIINKDNAYKYAEAYLSQNGEAIIKPTVGGDSGRGVNILRNLEQLNEYQDNWIIQEKISCAVDLKALNPTSVNTLRVITYIANDKLFTAPILIRMGVGQTHLDNAHAGGIFIGIDNEGHFKPEAFSEYGDRYSEHPYSHVRFNGYKINGVNAVINAAKECHKRTPHLRMISWDFTINDKGIPTLIEANLMGQSIWLPQIAHGAGVFEDNTEFMRNIIFSR